MEPVSDLIAALRKFPGLGNKSSKRIVFYLLRKSNEELQELGDLISGLKKNLYTCQYCGNVSAHDPCEICSDPLRDQKTICVVDNLEALEAFEQAGVYNGLYHVIEVTGSSKAGADFSEEEIKFLIKHVKHVKAKEVIIAMSPKVESDLAYYALVERLHEVKGLEVTKLGLGIPMGGIIEFADRLTLHSALESRKKVE
ncbi:MAG: recombination protein RecR [Synergistaceae bacterium]|nr:recombination protein RecR [Synergistaceae bacterium]